MEVPSGHLHKPSPRRTQHLRMGGKPPQTPPLRKPRYAKTVISSHRMAIFDYVTVSYHPYNKPNTELDVNKMWCPT